MKQSIGRGIVCVALCGLLGAGGRVATAAETCSIEHTPVTVSVRGQPLTVRARVKGDASAVDSMKLHYALSRDAAPYTVAMSPSGFGMYAGTVPAGILTDVGSVAYYIELVDKAGVTQETPWCTVELKDPAAVPAARITAPGATPAPARETSGWTWKNTAWVAGGVLAGVGAYFALSGGGGSSDDGTTTPDDGTPTPGNYSGTVTLVFERAGSAPLSESHAITITVAADGGVSSDDLYETRHLETTLSGSDFAFAVEVDNENGSGLVTYSGTVVGGRIVGSIHGSATSTEGVGSYYGSFNAALR